MMTLSVNKFRANLKHYVDSAIDSHEPLTVNRKNGEAFVVLSLEDYNREQETLYVLSNHSLMGQLEASLATYKEKKGYKPTADELGFESHK
ncbi:MAG: type II toxin-antitoxin system Phd/YefM family antitoxin [Campylobacterota bacterium]|nr:type II toxin-antitoxin system Phd/YefM family antitoxin [Campylobacterota bacterium]